jgi:hypothetical protein
MSLIEQYLTWQVVNCTKFFKINLHKIKVFFTFQFTLFREYDLKRNNLCLIFFLTGISVIDNVEVTCQIFFGQRKTPGKKFIAI